MKKDGNNLLYFCSSSVFGGAERFIETCLEYHKRKDENASVFFLNSGPFSERCKAKGYTVYELDFKVNMSRPLSWLRFQFYFRAFLNQHSVDIVHLTMAYSQVFVSLAAKFTRTKTVWFQHGPIGGAIDRVANLLPYNYLIVNSNYTKIEHLRNAGRIKSPMSILKISVYTKFNSKNVERIIEEFPGLRFICMGRICRWKGYEKAINALCKISTPSNLLILGTPSTKDDESYYNELKQLVEIKQLSKKIHFLGFKENVHDYLKASHALIHCSTSPEPYGLVVSESIALNVPVFASNLGGVIDQITSSDIGYLYNSQDELENYLCDSINNGIISSDNIIDLSDTSVTYGVETMMNQLEGITKSLLI